MAFGGFESIWPFMSDREKMDLSDASRERKRLENGVGGVGVHGVLEVVLG